MKDFRLIRHLVISFSFFALTFSTGIFSQSFAAGGTSSGGGNGSSDRMRTIIKWIDGTSRQEPIKAVLVRIAENAVKAGNLSSEHFSQLALLQDLVAKGLLNDIQQTEYQKLKKCVDDTGTEKSASTLKVDLSTNPEQAHPAVCINLPKLAADNTSYAELVGLLFHEHARHFGIEDTDDSGYQPFSDFVTLRYNDLNIYGLSAAKNSIPGFAAWQETTGTVNVFFFRPQEATESAAISFERIAGDCDNVMYKIANEYESSNYSVTQFNKRIPISFNYVVDVPWDDNLPHRENNWCFGSRPANTLTLQWKKNGQCTVSASLMRADKIFPLNASLQIGGKNSATINFQILDFSDPMNPENDKPWDDRCWNRKIR